MARRHAKQKTFAAPIARAPEPKPPQHDGAQFANGHEQSANEAEQHPDMPFSALLNLQRTVGNRQAIRVARKSAGAGPKIQRLMMTENSLYQTADEYDTSKEKRFRNDPDFRAFLSAVRIYDMFTRNKFKRSDIGQLTSLIGPIEQRMWQVDALAFKLRRWLSPQITRMVINAIDDVQQEKQALASIASDMTLPDNQVSFRQALFIHRSGSAYGSVLKDSDLTADPNGGEAGSPSVLGAGNVSTVSALNYNVGGGSERRAFKENEEIPGGRDDATNVDFHNLQSAMRAVATARIQALIKQKMEAAGQQFTSLIGNFDFAIYKGVLGTAATISDGHEIDKPIKDQSGRVVSFMSLNLDVNDITLQRQLANLQLFDILTGQGDRNMGNIMITQKAGQTTKVQGIDQDFAFSEDTDVTQNVGKSTMPQYIDRYFAEGVLAISDDELLAAMKGLAKTSRDTTMARFQGIKQHLQQMLGANQLVVAPGDTNHPGAPTWATIDTSTYRKSSFGTGKKDYAGSINHNRKDAMAAVKKNPNLKPKQVQKGNTMVWILETAPHQAYRAREDNGSDLFALVREALDELKRERGFAYTGNRQLGRPGFTMGVRKRSDSKEEVKV